MRHSRTSIAATAVLLLGACASAPGPETASLRCRHADPAGSRIGLYSFRAGELTVPPPDPDQVDIVCYFDADDCSEGAIIGHDDRPGYLFPIGHASWRELLRLEPPTEDDESVVAIAPLTADTEGFAFWVKPATGGNVLVRLGTIERATHPALVGGAAPRVEFEWFRPPPPPDRSAAPD